jgi:hypothetical protein
MDEKQLAQIIAAVQSAQTPHTQQPQYQPYIQPQQGNITAQGIHKWWPQLGGAVLIIGWLWNQSAMTTEINVRVENRLVQLEKIATKQDSLPDIKAALETIAKIDEAQNIEIKSIKGDISLLDKQIQAIRK